MDSQNQSLYYDKQAWIKIKIDIISEGDNRDAYKYVLDNRVHLFVNGELLEFILLVQFLYKHIFNTPMSIQRLEIQNITSDHRLTIKIDKNVCFIIFLLGSSI